MCKARKRRISNIIGIVVGGYKATKTGGSKKDWLNFIDELSKDEFMSYVFSKENAKETQMYYKLLYVGLGEEDL